MLRSRVWKTVFVFLLFLMMSLLVFAPTLKAFFLADDFGLIQLVRNNGPFGLWTYHNGWFRPVISLTFYLNYQLSGLNPVGYHFTNLLFHAANSLILYLLLLQMLTRWRYSPAESEAVSILAGALFLVLPSHSEAVAWISGRTDLIATFFAFLCLLFYLIYDESGYATPRTLCLAALTLALCAKESSLTIPFAIGAYEVMQWAKSKFAREYFVKSMTLLLPLGSIMITYWVVRYWSLGTLIGGYGTQVHLHFDAAQITQNFLLYWYRVFVPPLWYLGVRPNLQPSDPEFWTLRTIVAWISLFSILCLWVWMGWLYRVKRLSKQQALICTWLFISFCLVQMPSINIGIDITNSMGERFIYLSSGFAILMLGILLTQTFRKKVMRIGILTIFISISLAFSLRASENWRFAGDISHTIVATFPRLQGAEQVQIVGLPDNIHGAYIFRNGLNQALMLWNHIERRKQVIELPVKTSLVSKSDAITLNLLEKAGNNALYKVRLSDDARFFSSQTGFLTKNVEVSDIQNHSLLIHIYNTNEAAQIYFYSAGPLNQLQP